MVQTLDLSPQELDLVLYSGDGVTFRLVITDKNAEPVNLSGSMEAQIRTKRGATGDPSAEFDVDLSRASEGIATLTLTGAKSQLLAPADKKFLGVWDVQWTAQDAEPKTLCQGKVEVDPDVSR